MREVGKLKTGSQIKVGWLAGGWVGEKNKRKLEKGKAMGLPGKGKRRKLGVGYRERFMLQVLIVLIFYYCNPMTKILVTSNS